MTHDLFHTWQHFATVLALVSAACFVCWVAVKNLGDTDEHP
jgi:hypothetical protein